MVKILRLDLGHEFLDMMDVQFYESTYPGLDIEISEKKIKISSMLRLKHDNGRYYLRKADRSIEWMQTPSDFNINDSIKEAIKDFSRMVYPYITGLKKVDLNETFADGKEAYVLDWDQMPEEDRLKKWGIY